MWEDGIITDIRETGLQGTDFITGKLWVPIWTSSLHTELSNATLFSFSLKQILL
jgi:hypothetical protein